MGKRWSALAPTGPRAPHHDDFHSKLVRMESDMDEYDRAYVEGRLLGEGITGSVREVEHIATGRRYAMKSINLDRIDKAQVRELKTEIEILRQLDHPNIVRLHKVFQNKNNIKIVMELLTGGDLSRRRLDDEEDVRRVIFQLLSACRYWHARGVVHRDLKLENVLFSDKSPDSDVKVIDFGLGTTFYSEQLLEQQRRIRAETQRRPKSHSMDAAGAAAAAAAAGSTGASASAAGAGAGLATGSAMGGSAGHALRRKNSSDMTGGGSSNAFVSLLRASPRMGGSTSQLLDRRAADTAAAAAAAAARRAAEAPEPRTRPDAGSDPDAADTSADAAADAAADAGPGGAAASAAVGAGKSPLQREYLKLRRGSIATVNNLRRSAMGSPAAGPRRSRVVRSRIFQTTCGTAFYMAPEIMFRKGYSEKCDLWAVGVLTYMLITRKPPFAGKNETEVFQRVRRSSPSFEGRAWDRFSPAAKDFCKHLLTVNPQLRWTAAQALESAWMMGGERPAHKRRGSSCGTVGDLQKQMLQQQQQQQQQPRAGLLHVRASSGGSGWGGASSWSSQSGLQLERGTSLQSQHSQQDPDPLLPPGLELDGGGGGLLSREQLQLQGQLGAAGQLRAREDAAEAAQNLTVVRSMQRFARYPVLRRAALMIVSHNQSNFQNKALNRCFLAIDQSNRGFFGLDDLRAFVAEYDARVPDDTVRAIFASLDQDRSGVVRYMEFLAACIETTGPISDAQIAAAFEHFVPERGAAHITVRSLHKLLGRGYAKRDLELFMAEASRDRKMALPAFRRMMRAPVVEPILVESGGLAGQRTAAGPLLAATPHSATSAASAAAARAAAARASPRAVPIAAGARLGGGAVAAAAAGVSAGVSADWRSSAASDPGAVSPDGEAAAEAMLEAQRRWVEQQESIGAFDFGDGSGDNDDDGDEEDEDDVLRDEEDGDDQVFYDAERGDSFELRPGRRDGALNDDDDDDDDDNHDELGRRAAAADDAMAAGALDEPGAGDAQMVPQRAAPPDPLLVSVASDEFLDALGSAATAQHRGNVSARALASSCPNA